MLVVVLEKSQELRMQQVVTEVLGETALVIRSTTSTRLEVHGPFGKIWLPALPQTHNMVALLNYVTII